jgi:arylsulfatase A-like enzyme
MNRITRRDWLKQSSLAAGGFVCTNIAGAQPNPKPNIVFIFIDDMGWRDVGFMGSCFYETPNIDTLAGQGMIFTNAYANAPNCAPSRACIMSGQYAPRHGMYTVASSERGESKNRKLIPTPNRTKLPVDTVTLADCLQQNGYATGHFGKWHLGDDPEHNPLARGFDVYKGRAEVGFKAYHFARKDFRDEPEPEYLTDRLTDEACLFMEQNKEKPFFVNLWHHAVHVPVQAKKKMIEKYKDKEPCGGHWDAEYAAMVESVDQSVGTVMQKLDDLGLAENTLLLFFSDNGGYGPLTSMEPLRGAKGMLYEGGIREPMVIRWPRKVTAGTKCDTPVIGIDFFPTFLECSGISKPENTILDGESLVPLLTQSGAWNREALYWHFPVYLEAYKKGVGPWRTTPGAAIRKGDFKLIEFFEDETLELYNLKEDIGERHDLAAQMPETVRELHSQMKQWRAATNAPVPTEQNPDFVPYKKVERF